MVFDELKLLADKKVINSTGNLQNKLQVYRLLQILRHKTAS